MTALTLATLLAVTAACKSTSTATLGTAADDNLNAVLWMQDAAEYQAVCQSLYRAAGAGLDAALAQPDWDALPAAERDAAAIGLPPAIVMDVDETVLDNSPYQARLIRDGAEYSEASWQRWVTEQRARAVPGAVEFARAAHAKGITVLYLSNRAVHLKEATIANLKAVGLPVEHDGVFLGLGMTVAGCRSHGSEKTCRRRLVSRHYRVLMQFGDQLGDFAQVPENSRDGRRRLLTRYRGWFGERWWMLPNPSYGGWEPATFDNDWTRPRQARRLRKRRALDPAPAVDDARPTAE